MELIQSLNRPIPFKPEYKGLILSALSFILFPFLIRVVDSSAAAIDPGILSAILLSIAAVLIFQAVTWWVIRAIWPVFATYSCEQFTGNFKRLSGLQKVLVYLFLPRNPVRLYWGTRSINLTLNECIMKTSNSRPQVALSKRDLGFLNFLDQPYASGATMQLDQRDKLRLIIKFFEIVYFLINAVSKHLKKKKGAIVDSVLENLSKAITGEFPNLGIDYSKICILGGNLASPCGSMYSLPGAEKLNFSWASCTQMNSHGTDELMVMIYCPASRRYWFEPNLGITRADGFCTLDVPEEFKNAEVHVWLAYRSADGKEQSNSSYMGVRAWQPENVLPKTGHDGND